MCRRSSNATEACGEREGSPGPSTASDQLAAQNGPPLALTPVEHERECPRVGPDAAIRPSDSVRFEGERASHEPEGVARSMSDVDLEHTVGRSGGLDEPLRDAGQGFDDSDRVRRRDWP